MVGRVEGSVILIPPCGNARPLVATLPNHRAKNERTKKLRLLSFIKPFDNRNIKNGLRKSNDIIQSETTDPI